MTTLDKMATNVLKQASLLLLLYTQIFCSTATTDTKTTRKLHTQSVCNGTGDNGDVRLMYTRADGSNDTLHYMFSTLGVPALLVVRTDTNGRLVADCSRFYSGNLTDMAGSVNFTHRHYAYALIFNRLLEYNDKDDVADLTKIPQTEDRWRVYNMDSIPWDPLETSSHDENQVVFNVQNDPTSPISFKGNGSLSLAMTVMGAYSREQLLPHLEYNSNMTQLTLKLDNVNTSFPASRFAIEMSLVSLDGVPNKMALNSQTYIDDEHSPGVFQMIDWTAKGTKQDWSGFLQFKPVCYTSPARNLKDATKAVYYDLFTPNDTAVESSLAYAYFGKGMYAEKFSRTMANISFGLSKDKFYRHTDYTVWSASVGFGTPPSDQISLLIIIILSVGLGLPIVLISFGSISICIKKKMKKPSLYQEISSSSPDIN